MKTNSRIDAASSKEEAEKILFDIEIDKQNNNRRQYTDMGAMVLKYVIENVTEMSYYDFLNKYILTRMGLTDTHVNLPKYKLDRIALTNLTINIHKNRNFSVTDYQKGNVHDPKARVIGQIE